MMRPDAHVAVYVCVAPVDMRKQAATLALIVEQTLKRALGIGSAIRMATELYSPFQGLIRIPNTSLVQAVEVIDRN